MRAAVIVFPGSNCDRDLVVALRQSMASEPLTVWHGETELPKVDLIAIPGGFSYGDYLRSGAMAAHSPIMKEVVRRAEAGVAVIGICNGFQVLTETRLLPGILMRNRDLRFVCRDVHLRVEQTDTIFSGRYEKEQVVRIPVAHHDGNYFLDEDDLDALEAEGQVVFRYCNSSGAVTDEANPNGSRRNIAGVVSASRRILGLMPHPERLADLELGGDDGRGVFDSLVSSLG